MTLHMNSVAKLVMIDPDQKYLLMYRSAHPVFGDDPDLPGGTAEDGESPLVTMLREVEEEAGVIVDAAAVTQIYSGTEYSYHGTNYVLYTCVLKQRPAITMSWEHNKYEWMSRGEFLHAAQHAKDTYMHMVWNVLK